MTPHRSLILTCLAIFVLGCPSPSKPEPKEPKTTSRKGKDSPRYQNFQPEVAHGYEVFEFAKVRNARSLAVSPDGKFVFVGSRSGIVSKVTLGGEAPVVEVFQKDLRGSNGVCFVGDDLYVGELTRVVRYSAAEGFKNDSPGVPVLEGLPEETHHGYRYIRQGPDGRIRIGIGAPCNVCERKDDPRFATICSFTPEGKEFRIEAKGVRNTVGFDWHPENGDLYFTDNGRDNLGDDLPPCELNRQSSDQLGKHYGFPYLFGDNQKDPEFGEKAPDREFVPPLLNFQAHVAPLGCYFVKGEKARADFGNYAYIAQHGSWNRSSPIGYRVVRVDPLSPEPKAEPFLWGFLDPKGSRERYGRPVDVAELPDGTLLVSDDYRGVIWGIRKSSSEA